MTPQQRIRDAYGFDFPEEFFHFREFLAEVEAADLKGVCDMSSAAPFAIAAGEPLREHAERPLWASRYYNDLPEFVTVFGDGRQGLHWGYHFDDPGNLPPVVVYYWHRDSIGVELAGNTLFEAVRDTLERNVAEMVDEDDPDEWGERLEAADRVREVLSRYWGGDRPGVGDDYDCPVIDREDEVGETVQDLGIVVPATWYRPLSVRLFASNDHFTPPRPARDVVEPLIAEARLALVEGCAGTALELGHNLWPFAEVFPECYELLEAAYTRLDRRPLLRLMREAREYRAWYDRR